MVWFLICISLRPACAACIHGDHARGNSLTAARKGFIFFFFFGHVDALDLHVERKKERKNDNMRKDGDGDRIDPIRE